MQKKSIINIVVIILTYLISICMLGRCLVNKVKLFTWNNQPCAGEFKKPGCCLANGK